VRHRHLSLLNIYDYNDYSGTLRDSYFFPLAPGSIQSPPAASQLGDGIG